MPDLQSVSSSESEFELVTCKSCSDNTQHEYDMCTESEVDSTELNLVLDNPIRNSPLQFYEYVDPETRSDYCVPWMYNFLNHENFGHSDDLAPNAIGDMLTQRARYLLDICAPYPSDAEDIQERSGLGRFMVYAISETQFLIEDSENWGCTTDNEVPEWTFVSKDQLEYPTFSLPKWYALECAKLSGIDSLDEAVIGCYDVPMGNTYLEGAEWCLDRGKNYPGDPEGQDNLGRFNVSKLDNDIYLVLDSARGFTVELPAKLLQNDTYYGDN
ncbi:hypothetical protein K435DRAFT_871100 [Dendrothele bispora CBS 962.96]|uniref:Uncharacterized protein n=1 Tax=Dendrothele bispora (strain CBS 962.96) TaxID=1314807 RepID=A0A4S8L4Z3_DENBC|nr:hypothetical protein K435DRAFT_871100 [Dendrothele bispora CBS 962.96]